MLGPKILVAAALAGLAAAQTDTGLPAPWDKCCNLTDPGSVDLGERQGWCQAQYNSCTQLCGGQTPAQNKCDAGALTYDCQCYQSNTPNISDYSQTLPSLECQAWSGQCNTAQTGNSSAQAACQNVNCGHKNASDVASASSSSSSSAAPSSTTSSTGTQSGAAQTTTSAAPSSSGAAAAPVGISREASTGFVGALLFGVFGFFL